MNTVIRRAGRASLAAAMTVGLLSGSAGLALAEPDPTPAVTATQTPSTKAAVSRAAAADVTPGRGEPGQERVWVDANGNTFSYSVKRVSTGTEHGTANACFINSDVDGGYTPGDNTPEDDYACLNDTYKYEVDWNADVQTGTMRVVLNAGSDDMGKIQSLIWGGTSGGAGLPFTGRQSGADQIITFKEGSGVSAGNFTVTGGTDWQYQERQTGERNLLVNLKEDPTTGNFMTAVGDKTTTVLARSRFDQMISVPTVDSYNTSIDGKAYIGMGGLPLEQEQYVPAHQNPLARPSDYAVRKGHLHKIDMDATGARWTMAEVPPNGADVKFQINGGEFLDAQYDADGFPYIEAPKMTDKVRAYVEWDKIDDGPNLFTFRLDPTSTQQDNLGQDTFNGQPEPGSDLTCETTTANVYPDTSRGFYMPNNNCAQLAFDKRSGDGPGFSKTNQSPGVVYSGRTYSPATGTATGVLDPVESTVTIDPSKMPATNDLAICDVWAPGQERFSPKRPSIEAATGTTWQPINDFYPDAKIYYTDQDLTPGSTDQAPSCGTPGDGTSGWTTDRASLDQNEIGGFMVVFPGENRLRDAFKIRTFKTGTTGENYPNLVNENITNYFGYNATGNDEQSWLPGDYALMTVFGADVSIDNMGVENKQAPGIGAQTIEFDGTITLNRSADNLPGGTTVRIYPDKCLEDVTVTSGPYDAKYVEVEETGDDCGPGNSYIEYVVPMDYDGANPQKVLYTATTPAWTGAGDVFDTRMTAEIADSDAYAVRSPHDRYKNYTVNHRMEVPAQSVISASKSTPDPEVEINTPYTDSLSWLNYTDQELGRSQWIDVLPYDGDANGSSFSGKNTLTDVTYAGKPGVENVTGIEYTKTDPSSINPDPAHASNSDGSTVWCEELSGGACPSNLAEVTSLRFTIPDFKPGLAQAYTLSFSPTENKAGDKYVNRLSQGDIANLDRPLPSPPAVTTAVYASSLAGVVFNDADKDAARQDGEASLSGYTVELLDADGAVIDTTTSGDDGSYSFPDLPSGTYSVRVVNDKGVYTDITVAGGHTGDDADDGTTGAITLEPKEDQTGVDFGLWAPEPELTLTKSALGQTGMPENVDDRVETTSGDEVEWTYTVTNTGTVDVDDITVTDDQGVEVTCPKTTLAPEESMDCTGSGNVTSQR